jgi:hypothetical protein
MQAKRAVGPELDLHRPMRKPPQNGGRAGLVPCCAVTFATSAISAGAAVQRAGLLREAQAPSRL